MRLHYKMTRLPDNGKVHFYANISLLNSVLCALRCYFGKTQILKKVSPRTRWRRNALWSTALTITSEENKRKKQIRTFYWVNITLCGREAKLN